MQTPANQPVVQTDNGSWASDSVGAFDDSPLYMPYVEANARIGNKHDIIQGSLIIPLYQTDEKLLFADLRYHWAEPRGHEGNYGLAYRTKDNERIYGVYGFFDRIRTQNRNYFNQVTIGAEMMSLNWDFRVNGYLPQRDGKFVSGSSSATISGDTIFVVTDQERAYYGIDAEIGRTLVATTYGELRAFLTGYYFNRTEEGYPEIAGGRARVEYRLYDLPWLRPGSRLVLGGQCQYDDVRKDVASGLVSIRVPLGRTQTRKPTRLQRRMLDPIVRDVNVITNVGTDGYREKAIEPGQTLDNTVYLNSNTQDTATLIAGANDNALIIADGEITTSSPWILKTGQTLRGGGSMRVQGINTGNSATLALEPGVITATDPTQDVIVLADDSEIHGVSVSGGLNGVSGHDITNGLISDSSITGAQNVGVLLSGSSNATVQNSTISSGIQTGHFAGNIINSTIDANLQNAIQAQTFSGNISGNILSGDTDTAIDIGQFDGGIVTNNTVHDNQTYGLKIDNISSGDITNNRFTGTQPVGFDVGEMALGNISGNTFADANGWGFRVGTVDDGTISNNVFGGNRSSGGFMISSMSAGSVVGNIFNGDQGNVGFLANVDDGIIENNQFNGSQVTGFEANVGGTAAVRGNTFAEITRYGFEGGISEGTIENNVFSFNTSGPGQDAFGNSLAAGFRMYSMNGGTIQNNQFNGTLPIGFDIYEVLGGSIQNNTFDITYTGAANYSSGRSSIASAGFALYEIEGGTIQGNTFSGTLPVGFNVYDVNAGSIQNNTFANLTEEGFIVYQVTGGTISKNTFGGDLATSGFRIYEIEAGEISENTFTGSQNIGFRADRIHGGTIRANEFVDVETHGFEFAELNGGTVENNIFNGPIGFSGGQILGGSIANNTFNRTYQGFLISGSFSGGDLTGNTFNGTQSNVYSGSTLAGSITGNTFENVVTSILTLDELTGDFSNNTIGGTPTNGIQITNAIGAVSGNTFSTNGIGIDIQNSSVVSDNTIGGNPTIGIRIENAGGSVSGNSVSNSQANGIEITNANGSVSGNTVDNSDGHGIFIATAANGLTISDNTVTNNTLDGLRVDDYSGSSTSGGINNNTATSNGETGIYLTQIVGGRIDGNNASRNGGGGMVFGTWTPDTWATGNSANSNTGTGFHFSQPMNGRFVGGIANGNGNFVRSASGFRIPSISNGVFTNNRSTSNAGYGFSVGSVSGTIAGNIAFGNGTSHVCQSHISCWPNANDLP
ncbi:right-handed parallel beta-helix repeat-containing protein [bacterium]|nr:right-handed parallel beta-helix repeat-containing protein [bacterium]